MPEIQYPKNPNSDTAFVVQEDGTKNRALMTAPQDTSTLELPKNANSCKGYVTVDGKKQRVILTADIGGGSGDEYLPLAGGTMTGDIAFSKTGYNDKVVGNHNGYLRIGTSTTPSNDDLFVSTGSGSDRSIAFGDGNGGQLGSSAAKFERTYTQKLNNGADIAVPTVAGAIALQESTMPTADAASVGVVVQYVGATDATYTNGYFYKCVSDGQDPATYSWEEVSLGGGGAGLPDQTGQSGKFLTTDGTDASWSDKPLVNKANGTDGLTILGTSYNTTNSVVVGKSATTGITNGSYSVLVGYMASASQNNGIAVGARAATGAVGAIQIGSQNPSSSFTTNSDANTFKVANANGNFEMMDANGNLPADRLASTTGLTDGNYRLRLVMASGVPTLSWVAE